MSVDFRLGEVLVGWSESWWVTEGRAALRSAWIICCGKGRLAQSMASRLFVSAAPVMTCLSLASISAREMPGICCSGTKHRCTYSRTAGGHSTRFLVSVEEAGAAVMVVVVVVEAAEAVEEALRASVRRAWTGVYAGAVGPGESVSAAQPPSKGVLPLADARHAAFISISRIRCKYDVSTMRRRRRRREEDGEDEDEDEVEDVVVIKSKSKSKSKFVVSLPFRLSVASPYDFMTSTSTTSRLHFGIFVDIFIDIVIDIVIWIIRVSLLA